MFSFSKRQYSIDVIESLHRKKKNARDRDLTCTLSLKNMEMLLNAKYCYYTGVRLSTKKNKLSIERIDSEVGYVPGNVIPVSTIVNQVKSNFTIEEMKHMVNVSLLEKIAVIETEIAKITLRNANRIKQLKYFNGLKTPSEKQEFEKQHLAGHLDAFRKALQFQNTKLIKHQYNREILIKVINTIENKPFMAFDFMTPSQKLAYVAKHMVIFSTKNVLFEFANFKFKGMKNAFGHLTSNV